MKNEKNIGVQRDLGRMDLIHQHIRDTRSAVVFSAETQSESPEMWKWLPGLHKDAIANGQTLLIDASLNGIYIPDAPVNTHSASGAEVSENS